MLAKTVWRDTHVWGKRQGVVDYGRETVCDNDLLSAVSAIANEST